MSKVQEIFEKSNKSSEFATNYLKYLVEIAGKIDAASIGRLADMILEAREKGSAVYFIGNGGSAATSSHFANDIQIGTRTTGKPFRVQSLTDNVAILTAIGNDFGYDFIFSKQIEALAVPGDIVVAISASGNSPNVVKGLESAQKIKCKTVSLTGFDGGKIKGMTDLNIHVPSLKGEYGPVEDFHMIVDHIVGNYLHLYCRKNDS